MSTTIEMNAYSTGADEGEVNLGEKWARRESVALHKDGESVLPGDKASAPLATKSNVHPWYKRPPFIAAVTVCALVAIIVPSVLLTGDDAEPNLGPTTYGVYEDCNDLRKAVEEDFSGRGSYSYWGTSWQSVAQYGCCDSLAADRRSCQSGALMYRGQPEVMAADAGVAIRGSGASSDSGSGSPSSPASEFSSTNNQVKDVDEPDIVKNDGMLLLHTRLATTPTSRGFWSWV